MSLSGKTPFVRLCAVIFITLLLCARPARSQDNKEAIDRLTKDVEALKTEIRALREAKPSAEPGKTAQAEPAAEKVFNPDAFLKKLEKGNSRFVAGKPAKKDFPVQRKGLASAQHPYAIVLTCADSRVPPELLFDESLGQLFVLRNAGNVVDSVTLGSIEYAAEHLHTALLIVLGHESCGAVTAAAGGGQVPPNIGSIVWRITPAVESAKSAHGASADLVHASVEENVRLQMKDAVAGSEILRELIGKGEFGVIGGVYNLETGKVTFLKSNAPLLAKGK
jgi:carbonic anhydrase